MKFKGSKIAAGSWTTLGLPSIFLLCLFFFLAGFFGASLFSQQESSTSNLRPRTRELVEEKIEFEGLPHGDSGGESVEAIPFQILSWKPRALYFPNFATEEQCQSIIKMAKEKLKPSTLALREGETAENTKGIRTSSGMFISAYEDKTGTLDQIEEKIAKVTMISKRHGESFNVLRYEIGQRYQSHYDAFNPAEYGPQKSQRVASFLLYLSDVEEGGETMFPLENGQNMDSNYDFGKCLGLKVKPQRGDGLLFYSVFPNGTIDPTSLHGSCPVIKGEKWVATKWVRDQEQDEEF
ncbi:2-oxoglutarate and oxygenase superfamily protein [Perilla frutescens var. hirtella]|uniref:procollagen-proline 4-dioxygenase n=1 Tax=Perilla frutescens var. hirtella TaxID=608512 RepID=A0AAD4JQJ0_PERFH|nr:2-oxoglutarate and oxygenase superfamily protein [Perilla frutescens var. hirtella]